MVVILSLLRNSFLKITLLLNKSILIRLKPEIAKKLILNPKARTIKLAITDILVVLMVFQT